MPKNRSLAFFLVDLVRALPPRWINGGYIHFRNRLEAERLYRD